MSRVAHINWRYAASAALAINGVEIIAVGDPIGARLNALIRLLLLTARDDEVSLWDDLIGAAKSLRWRLLTQPQPIETNHALTKASEELVRQARLLHGAVMNDALLDELTAISAAVVGSDPVLGTVLERCVEEVGPTECVVVAASQAAATALAESLRAMCVNVLTVGEVEHIQTGIDQAFAIGPPRFFRSSLIAAPNTSAVTFLMPAWFRDRQIPHSAISAYADGAIRIRARVHTEGDLTEPEVPVTEEEVDDEFFPQPVWGTRQSPDREPNSDEVEARKLLLSGGQALWLDDGERIRAVDPEQPVGERVIYVDVPSVRVGTYLLLRQGETERPALYQAALDRLGSHGVAVDATQQEWKSRLRECLSQRGYRAVVRALRNHGVTAADQARAWTEPNLVRPHSDHDFEKLLVWLNLRVQPYFGNATLLRRAIYQVSAEIREQLETAVSDADLSALKREGTLSLDVPAAGFRGILAIRVLAISPHTEIVSRRDARVPFDDRSAQWLE